MFKTVIHCISIRGVLTRMPMQEQGAYYVKYGTYFSNSNILDVRLCYDIFETSTGMTWFCSIHHIYSIEVTFQENSPTMNQWIRMGCSEIGDGQSRITKYHNGVHCPQLLSTQGLHFHPMGSCTAAKHWREEYCWVEQIPKHAGDSLHFGGRVCRYLDQIQS